MSFVCSIGRCRRGEGHDPADLVVFNAGNNQRIDFRQLTAAQFEDFWRIGCFGGFLVGREAARRLAPLGRGTVIFTGASASLRGKPDFAHFAAAKAGLRMISQSMAREYGPLGIHVAHVVVDGGINGDCLLKRMPTLIKDRGEDGLLGIDAIADTFWHIHQQQRSAWSQEVDLRPYKERSERITGLREQSHRTESKWQLRRQRWVSLMEKSHSLPVAMAASAWRRRSSS